MRFRYDQAISRDARSPRLAIRAPHQDHLPTNVGDGTRAMQLLVSVASAAEASAALAGGADVIDAKDPHAGALGAVSMKVLREIHAAVAGARLVTAALGDAADEAAIERAGCAFATAGAALVKIGFAGIVSARRVA